MELYAVWLKKLSSSCVEGKLYSELVQGKGLFPFDDIFYLTKYKFKDTMKRFDGQWKMQIPWLCLNIYLMYLALKLDIDP